MAGSVEYLTLKQFSSFCDPNSTRCFVDSVSHYKERRSPAHELLIIHLRSPGLPRVSKYVRLDRSRAAEATSLINSSSSRFPAHDTVEISDDRSNLLKPADHVLMYTLLLPTYEMSEDDLRALLVRVTSMSPTYTLSTEQCYWFCSSILSIIHGAFDGSELREESGYKQAGKLVGSVRPPFKGTATTEKIREDFLRYLSQRAESVNNSSSIPHLPNTHPRPPMQGRPLLHSQQRQTYHHSTYGRDSNTRAPTQHDPRISSAVHPFEFGNHRAQPATEHGQPTTQPSIYGYPQQYRHSPDRYIHNPATGQQDNSGTYPPAAAGQGFSMITPAIQQGYDLGRNAFWGVPPGTLPSTDLASSPYFKRVSNLAEQLHRASLA